jgi:hypothetical protein
MVGHPSRMKQTVIWFIWFVSFVWLNKTNQINKTNQTNQINQSCCLAAILLAGCRNTMWALQHVTGLHIMDNNGTSAGCSKRPPARPQQAKR